MTGRNKAARKSRRWFEDMQPVDFVLGFLGLCLGTAAALFPWYVYMNPESYGPPQMAFSRGGVVPVDEVAALATGDPLFDFATGKFIANDRQAPLIDPLITGNVDKNAQIDINFDQEFPSNGKPFDVLAVDAARALVGDSGGIYLVRRKSRLPDGTLVMDFEHDGSEWRIRTSQDKLLRAR